MDINSLIKENRGTIVDIRSRDESLIRKVANTLNIPWSEFPLSLTKIFALPQPMIIFCNDGKESEVAVSFLQTHSILAYNGGSRLDINFYQSQGVCPS